MHTFDAGDVILNYNSDGSGNVQIVAGSESIEIPFDALLSFIADFVRTRKIAALDCAADADVLGFPE